jgi:hypothetical protein
MRLYDIWLACMNTELCEEIQRQRERIIIVIEALERILD